MKALIVLLALASGPASEDARLAGRWRDSERDTVSELIRADDGSWSGVIVASPRATELGKRSFEALRWHADDHRFVGHLIKPDDGQRVDVQVWLDTADTLTAEARVLIFRRSLRFTRVKEVPHNNRGSRFSGAELRP